MYIKIIFYNIILFITAWLIVKDLFISIII